MVSDKIEAIKVRMIIISNNSKPANRIAIVAVEEGHEIKIESHPLDTVIEVAEEAEALEGELQSTGMLSTG